MCLLGSIGGGACGGLGTDVSTKRKKGGVPIVAQPGAQLMGTAKALYTSGARLKHPRCIVVRLEGPVRHAKRERGYGERVAAREVRRRCRPLKKVDPVDGIATRLHTRATWRVRSIPGTNDTFLHQNGGDCSQPGCFQEGAPAGTNRLILQHVRRRDLS